ncbi:hypothetical protein SCNU_17622 [Gordonia neofelifaecis NRRL B-59395]|uniref:Uncharacterized protein n=2 Tax=Gordonia TaxID=2053 RepID=F1YNM5_9ACTN|nr:hypothetical protein SCNU_17622 [Gordonia neofelifaecis NRRL B-59395]
MDDNEIRAGFRAAWSGEYVPIDELTADEAASIPDGWADLVGQSGTTVAAAVSGLWRDLAPGLTRTADLLERDVMQMGLARIRTPHHYVQEYRLGASASSATTEIALMYLLRDPRGRKPYIAWFGRTPFTGDLPDWWPSARAVVGDLATGFHDGFMRYSWDCGLLAIPDMHTVSQRWIEYTDTEAQLIEVTSGDDDRPVPREAWPDFRSMHVIAESTSEMGWAVADDVANGSGWGDGPDTMHPIANLAEAIEPMLGR